MIPLLVMFAADLPRGTVIDKVQAASNPTLSYALYIPANYTPERLWPVLYCLDPGARGRVPVERFAKAAEAEGFIVAGSNNSRNGPIEPVKQAIDAMMEDTDSRLSLDPKRVYAAGFSGGSRVALLWGLGGQLAGVVACGAAFGAPGTPAKLPFALFAAAGVDDFNYGELHELSLRLKDTNQRFSEFEGGHEWLPDSLALEALQFFNGKLPARAATPSKDERRIASRLQQIYGRMEASPGNAGEKLIEQLRKDSESPVDTPDRRLARRALGGGFVGAIERARSALQSNNWTQAERLLERALLIRPGAANAQAMLEQAKKRGR